jgi:hypothetical protein
MAAFTTLAQAEARAKAKVADGTWVVAHSERLFNGQIAVAYIQFMSTAGMADPARGGWKHTTDDSVT